jgi:predicted nucleotidyltransferase
MDENKRDAHCMYPQRSQSVVTQKRLYRAIRQRLQGTHIPVRAYLYGSRARGEAQQSSDWDILLIVPDSTSKEEQSLLYRTLYELEWESGEVLSCILMTETEWERLCQLRSPFTEQVCREAVPL